jgi:hypothetical protein
MLCRTVPKNRVNLVLYRVIVVCGRIFIDGFLGFIHPALPTSRLCDRRHTYRTLDNKVVSHHRTYAMVANRVYQMVPIGGGSSRVECPRMVSTDVDMW